MTIITPPENTTVCRGSNVTIRCGYTGNSVLPVMWIINGSSFDQSEIVNSPLYQLNNPGSPMTVSLTILSINDSTTIQCIVQSTPVTYSTRGTITVTGMSVCTYTCTYVYICTYVCTYTCYLCIVNVKSYYAHIRTDIPVVQIATITSGLDSVNVSWTSSTGNGSDTCTIALFVAVLTSGDVNMIIQVTMKSYIFTGLPSNTKFDFLLQAQSVSGIISKTDSRTVRTESMCTCIRMCQYNNYYVICTEIQYEFLIFK